MPRKLYIVVYTKSNTYEQFSTWDGGAKEATQGAANRNKSFPVGTSQATIDAFVDGAQPVTRGVPTTGPGAPVGGPPPPPPPQATAQHTTTAAPREAGEEQSAAAAAAFVVVFQDGTHKICQTWDEAQPLTVGRPNKKKKFKQSDQQEIAQFIKNSVAALQSSDNSTTTTTTAGGSANIGRQKRGREDVEDGETTSPLSMNTTTPQTKTTILFQKKKEAFKKIIRMDLMELAPTLSVDTIYTDGSCPGNGKLGAANNKTAGYGAYYLSCPPHTEISQPIKDTEPYTNNRGEMTAVMVVLERADKRDDEIGATLSIPIVKKNNKDLTSSSTTTGGGHLSRVVVDVDEGMDEDDDELEELMRIKLVPMIDIRTDSKHTMNAATDWIDGWKKNNFFTSQNTSVANESLIRRIDESIIHRRKKFYEFCSRLRRETKKYMKDPPLTDDEIAIIAKSAESSLLRDPSLFLNAAFRQACEESAVLITWVRGHSSASGVDREGNDKADKLAVAGSARCRVRTAAEAQRIEESKEWCGVCRSCRGELCCSRCGSGKGTVCEQCYKRWKKFCFTKGNQSNCSPVQVA